MKNPVIIPANEKILFRNPFLRPRRAGMVTIINIITSKVFKMSVKHLMIFPDRVGPEVKIQF